VGEMFCRSVIVLFLLTIVLPALARIMRTASDA
jgi:hypothetical protein